MRIPGLAIASVLALCAARPAAAALTLNATGLSYGFTLSTFATGNTYSYNHLSAAPLSDGTLAGVDFANGAIVKYNDVDGQTTGTNLGSVSLTNVTTSRASAATPTRALMAAGITRSPRACRSPRFRFRASPISWVCGPITRPGIWWRRPSRVWWISIR